MRQLRLVAIVGLLKTQKWLNLGMNDTWLKSLSTDGGLVG